MRSQKWTIALLSLGLATAPAFSGVARADDAPQQGSGQGPGSGHHRGAFLEHFHATVNKLDLTADQKPKIEAAFAEAKTAADAALKDAAGDRDAIREKMKPIMDTLRSKVDAVLTDDQKAKLKELRAADHPGGHRQHPGSNPAA